MWTERQKDRRSIRQTDRLTNRQNNRWNQQTDRFDKANNRFPQYYERVKKLNYSIFVYFYTNHSVAPRFPYPAVHDWPSTTPWTSLCVKLTPVGSFGIREPAPSLLPYIIDTLSLSLYLIPPCHAPDPRRHRHLWRHSDGVSIFTWLRSREWGGLVRL